MSSIGHAPGAIAQQPAVDGGALVCPGLPDGRILLLGDHPVTILVEHREDGVDDRVDESRVPVPVLQDLADDGAPLIEVDSTVATGIGTAHDVLPHRGEAGENRVVLRRARSYALRGAEVAGVRLPVVVSQVAVTVHVMDGEEVALLPPLQVSQHGVHLPVAPSCS